MAGLFQSIIIIVTVIAADILFLSLAVSLFSFFFLIKEKDLESVVAMRY